MVIEP
jgi:hypothetical protein